ncbi:hypothetical protein BGW38_003608 [Lunasporangiospora selenospora]|uniref:Uncharacterized protein n=1 Tax=Lunasporangiospora selenospora TaxID=979761 RepID=A0A9P6G2P7_9FUNG|nr:hypothetical protein BGW38_003608 [Lunasporangiospora selenospora]
MRHLQRALPQGSARVRFVSSTLSQQARIQLKSRPFSSTSTTASASTTSSSFSTRTSKSAAGINQSKYSPSFRSETTELPKIVNRTPFYVALGLVGLGFWVGSIAVLANHQRQGTSIVRGTLFNVKYDTKARELLGEDIDFVNPKWPWISGTIAHLKGRVDIEYQVRGEKAEGRVHFVAIRPVRKWITADFTLTMPDGTVAPRVASVGSPSLRFAGPQHPRNVFARFNHSDITQRYADKLKRKAQEYVDRIVKGGPVAEGVQTIEELKAKVLPQTQTAFKKTQPLEDKSEVKATLQQSQKTQQNAQAAKAPSASSGQGSNPSLDKIIKLDLIADLPADDISKIWIQKHMDQEDTISAVVPAETYKKMLTRSRMYPVFLLPLSHNDGVEFHLMQFAFHQVMFTSLLEYQTHGENARPYMTITHYPELIESKGIVLMQGTVSTDPRVLTLDQAQVLTFGLQQYYVSDHPQKLKLLEDFHKRPQEFSHEKLIELTEISG